MADPPEPRRPLTPGAAGFAVGLAALWGGNPVAIKAGLDDAGPLRLGWMRMLLGGVVVLAWAVATRQPLWPARGEWIPLLGVGVLFAVQIACMNVGQDNTTAAHAVLLNTTFPLWAGVIAHVVVPGDRLSRDRVLGTVLAYSGVVVVFSEGLIADGAGLTGDALMLCSAILLGSRQIYLSQAAQGIGVPKLLLAQSVFGAGVFVPAGVLVESEAWVMTGGLALALFYQGVVIAGFGFIGNTWLLKRYLPSQVTSTQIFTPVFGVVFSWLILGEAIGPEVFAGATLVVLGSYYAQRATFRPRRVALEETADAAPAG